MVQENQQLSYERLVSRAKYYKEKSLDLEKKYIFATEKIAWLETRLEKVKKDNASTEELQLAFQQKIDKLNDAYQALEEAYKNEKKQNELTRDRHQSQSADKQYTSNDLDKETINHYEQLLSEVQKDINDKEEQINVYQKRITALEKRLKMSSELSVKTQSAFSSNGEQTSKAYRTLGYFDYAIVMDQDKCIIRGDYTLENVGENTIETPYICFRFYPADAAHLKGKTIVSHESELTSDSLKNWVLLDNDWANEARERGELWLHPISSFQLSPGEKAVINDFQIPVNTKLCDHITVETFIYSQSDNFRSKGLNQIIVNF